MAITKKTATKKATAPATVAEPITVSMVRLYGEDGSRNEDNSDVISVVQFPEGVQVVKVAVMIGTSADYGAVKGSVTVSVPSTLEEIDGAFAYGYAKAQEFLDLITDGTADADAEEAEEDEEEEVEEKPKGKAKPAAKKKAAAVEEEEDEEAEEEEESEESEEDEDGLGPEDIDAMDRKQLVAFCEEFKEDDDYDAELDEVDPDDFKKTKAGLIEFKDAVKAALFDGEDAEEEEDEEAEEDEEEESEDEEEGELYTEDELEEASVKDLKAIWKEWEIGKLPNAKTEKALKLLMIKGILKHQEENAGDEEE